MECPFPLPPFAKFAAPTLPPFSPEVEVGAPVWGGVVVPGFTRPITDRTNLPKFFPLLQLCLKKKKVFG